MSLWLDIKFVKQIASRLDSFVLKKDGGSFLANVRCHICGDSEKHKNKKRGYFFSHDDKIFYKCQNCGVSYTFDFFLKGFDPNLHHTYRLECFKEKYGRESFEEEKVIIPKTQNYKIKEQVEKEAIFDDCVRVIELPDEHIAKTYLLGRMLPKKHLNMFWYVDKFFSWASKNSDHFPDIDDLKDHPRIIIPWYNEKGDVFAYQGRSLNGEDPKYYTIILNSDFPKIFGLDRIDRTKPISVVEGGLDSLFIPNCVAVGSSDLKSFKEGSLYIYDNEPRSKEIVSLMYDTVKLGYNIFVPPDNYKWKDMNDAIVKGKMSVSELRELVSGNSFSGLSAIAKLNKWKRVEIRR